MLIRSWLFGLKSGNNVDQLFYDFAPYLFLVVGLLTTKILLVILPTTLNTLLEVISSPALWLLIASGTVPIFQNLGKNQTKELTATSLSQWRPIATTTVLFLALGVILAASGMSEALASTGAQAGPIYPAIAPWIGALGGFLTGSNTGASAMFAASQAQAAKAIGYPVLTLVALHNVGASLAIMAAVPKVIMSIRLVEDAVRGSTNVQPDPIAPAWVFARVIIVNIAVLAVLSGLSLFLN